MSNKSEWEFEIGFFGLILAVTLFAGLIQGVESYYKHQEKMAEIQQKKAVEVKTEHIYSPVKVELGEPTDGGTIK